MSAQELVAMGQGSGSAHPQVEKAEAAGRVNSAASTQAQAHSLLSAAPPKPPRPGAQLQPPPKPPRPGAQLQPPPKPPRPAPAGPAAQSAAPAKPPRPQGAAAMHPMLAKTAAAAAFSGERNLPVNGAHSLMAGLPPMIQRQASGAKAPAAPAAPAAARQDASAEAALAKARAQTGSKAAEVAKPAFVVGAGAATGLSVGNTSDALDSSDGSSGAADMLLGMDGSQLMGALAGTEAVQGLIGLDAIMTRVNGQKMVDAGTKGGDAAWAELGRDKIKAGNQGMAGSAAAMAAGGLKAGGKIMEGSASALGTFGSAGTALIGAGGVITAAKGVYDLVESGKSLHQATKVKAAAKGAGGKLRTSLGRLWMQRVAERQAVKQKTSVLKGIGAALGIAGAVAAMFTPIGWAIALAGAAIGIGIAAAKIVKKVQDAGAKKQTESIFAKAAPQKQPKEGGPEARPAMHPQQAKAASARAAGAAPGRSLNDAHPLAEPAAAPGGDRAKDAEAGARAAAEAAPVAPAAAAGGPAAAADGQAATYAALSIDPALGFNPAIPATQSPDAVAAKAKVAEKGAQEVIEALESNKQVADGVHEALVTDPRTGEPYDEQRDAAEEDKRSYGNDAGLVVDALQIDKPVAASPSGSLLLQKRMSALDGI